RLPAHLATGDDVDASRLRRQAEPAAGTRATAAPVRCFAFPSSAPRAAPYRGRRDDGDAVTLVRLAEHPLHGERVPGLLHQLVRVHLNLLCTPLGITRRRLGYTTRAHRTA